MQIKDIFSTANFLKSAQRIDQLPADFGYEVAFAGRSNAGKSSALNTLTKKNIARISKTPGRTQLLNVFTINIDNRRLIDLPGYGYAKVPQSIKINWQQQLAMYLEKRQSLKGLILLMDIRHPLQSNDLLLLNWAIECQLPVHILLTKSDKLSTSAAKSILLKLQKQYQQFNISVQTFSSLKKQGIEALEKVLFNWLDIS